jgi:hypothetical protein
MMASFSYETIGRGGDDGETVDGVPEAVRGWQVEDE